MTTPRSREAANQESGYAGAAENERGKAAKAWVCGAVGVVFVLFVAIAAHLLFSAHGFNPTDEGYYLSNARRVLDGEVPHRDFITLRPAGAYFIFAPIVAVAGDSALWAARFAVLLELAAIAWIWALMIHRHMGQPFGRWAPVAPAAVAFMLTLGWYPIDVSTTIEGWFCFTVGLHAVLRGSQASKAIGYFVIGCGYLCRQNLLFAGGVALIALGDWRHLRYWVAGALPGLVYVGWLGSVGGLADFISQVGAPSTNGSSPGGFFAIGVAHWLRSIPLWVGLLCGVAGGLLIARDGAPRARAVSLRARLGVTILLGVAIGGSLFTMRYGHARGVPDFRWYSFAVAGLLAGLLIALYMHRREPPEGWRLGVAALGMAWALSFSWAFPAPALALGPLVLLTIAFVVNAADPRRIVDYRRWTGTALTVLMLPLAAILYQARQGWLSLNPPASRLTRSLDGVFPGARHLLTDENTYTYLVDFEDALRKVRTADVVVGPDLGAYWVRAPRPNPVSINWLFYGELINTALEQRILHELEAKRGSYTFVASKVMVRGIADGFEPVPPWWSPVQDSVRAHFAKVGETRYFELYR